MDLDIYSRLLNPNSPGITTTNEYMIYRYTIICMNNNHYYQNNNTHYIIITVIMNVYTTRYRKRIINL